MKNPFKSDKLPGFETGKNFIKSDHPLEREDTFQRFIRSYSVYYDIETNTPVQKDEPSNGTTDKDITAPAKKNAFTVAEGFDAEARFNSKSEQYFLVKAAKVADIDTAEYVYFKHEDELTEKRLALLDEKAWNAMLSMVNPGPSHKNTDAVLIIFADKVSEGARDFAFRAKHSKNYNHALYGYSNYRLIVIELEKGIVYFNKQAKILMELVGKILKKEKEN